MTQQKNVREARAGRGIYKAGGILGIFDRGLLEIQQPFSPRTELVVSSKPMPKPDLVWDVLLHKEGWVLRRHRLGLDLDVLSWCRSTFLFINFEIYIKMQHARPPLAHLSTELVAERQNRERVLATTQVAPQNKTHART